MKLVGERQDNWDEFLDPVLFGIRTSIQESTKHTPFFLMHGREARLPLEAEKSTVISDPSQLADVTNVVHRLNVVREKIFPTAKKNIDTSQSKQKEQYRRRKGLVMANISVGDTVLRLNMLKRTKKGHKMEDSWLGPYKVLHITARGCCLIQCVKTGTQLKRKVNISQLKLYHVQGDSKCDATDNSGTSKRETTAESEHDAAEIRGTSERETTKSLSAERESGYDTTEIGGTNERETTKSLSAERESEHDATGRNKSTWGVHETTDRDLQILEKQLFSGSLLRLWKTGAVWEAWRSEDDECTDVSNVIFDLYCMV